MKNIAFVTFSLQGGGSEKRILQIASYFNRKSEFSTDIISFKEINNYQHLYRKDDHSEILYLTGYQTRIPRPLVLFVLLNSIIRLIKQVRKKQYSLLIGVDIFSWFLVYVCHIYCSSKYILNVCIPISQEAGNWSFLFKPIVFAATKIICISRGVAFDFVNLYKSSKRKTIVIYNGVVAEKKEISKRCEYTKTIDKLKKMKKERGFKFIITAGRLVPQKGHEFLIKSFKHTYDLNEKTVLIILGKGPLEDKLKELTYRLQLKKNVFFLSFRQHLEQYFKIADIFVLSSFYEGFGNIIVEAMAQGLPVVSTDCPYGPREIISAKEVNYSTKPIDNVTFEKYGVLVPPLDKMDLEEENYLSKAILYLLNDKKLRKTYSSQGQMRAWDFSVEKMGRQYLRAIKIAVEE